LQRISTRSDTPYAEFIDVIESQIRENPHSTSTDMGLNPVNPIIAEKILKKLSASPRFK